MKKKTLIILLCAVFTIGSAAFGTIAYLTDRSAVVNRFTIGNVTIDVDETVVTPDGVPVDSDGDGENDRTSPDPTTNEEGNTYHLLPGQSYTKDPTLTVKAGSEQSYVRMLVTITYIDQVQSVFGADFLPENYASGWDSTIWPCVGVTAGTETVIDPLTQQETIVNTAVYEFRYYTAVNAVDETGAPADVQLEPLFTGFTVPGEVTAEQLELLQPVEIRVEGNAIQTASFENAEAAWAAFPAPVTTIINTQDQ